MRGFDWHVDLRNADHNSCRRGVGATRGRTGVSMATERVLFSTLLLVCMASLALPQSRAAAAELPANDVLPEPAGEIVSGHNAGQWSDLFKGIPIGCSCLDVGGSLRYRFEHQDDFNVKRYADANRARDSFLLQRFRLDFNFRFREDARAYVQLQDARPFGINFSKEDFVLGCPYWNYLDLRQAYVERRAGKDSPLDFKIGRQAIFYADNRVWGPGEWGNVGRYTWDAAKLIVDAPRAQIDFIFGDRIQYDPGSFDGNHDQFHAYGVYATLKDLPFRLDLFYIKKESHGNYVINSQGETLDVDTSTLGFYADGKLCKRWDYRGTFAHTFGMRDHVTVEAYGANARLGYTFDVPWKLRIGGEFSYASGDPDPESGRDQTFDGLFGAIDMMYGRMNLFSWKNLHDYQASLGIKPTPKTGVTLDWHFFRLDKAADAWYYCNGRPQRRDPTGAAGTELGHEIDLIAKCQYSDACRFQVGYAHFFPGTFLKRTGAHPDCDWFFFQVMYEL